MTKLMLALLVSLGCCWTLIGSYYDTALNKWVCTYVSQSGTQIRQLQNGPCSPTPE